MDRTATPSGPLNQADFYALERAAVSYLYSVTMGTERYDDGRYRSAMVLLGFVDKHHAATQTPTKAAPAHEATNPGVLYDQEVEAATDGGSGA